MTATCVYYVNTRLRLWTQLRCPRTLPQEWQETTFDSPLMLQAQREGFRQVMSDNLANAYTVSIFDGDTCLVSEMTGRATIYPIMEAIHLLPKALESLREKVGQTLTVCFGDAKCWEIVISSINDIPPHFAMLSKMNLLPKES